MYIQQTGTPNIIVFNQNISAGVSTILKNIIRYKPDSTINYKLVLYHYDNLPINNITENWCDEVLRIQLSSKDNLYKSIKQLKNTVDQNSIIVANDVTELRMVALLKMKNPLIYIVHGDFETYYKQCDYFQDYMDIIIVYSKQIANKLEKRLKYKNRSKIRLIYYPVPVINCTYSENNRVEIVFAGSLTKRKGIDLLPGIIKLLDASPINYLLTIIGGGEEEKWLRQNIGDSHNAVLVGQKSNQEVIEAFVKSDILLFPTRSEGLPNVLVEAMKAGCIPVVSNIESGIPDVVEHGIDGYLVEPESIEQFTNTIIELASSDKLLKIKNAAIKKANNMFNPKINAKKYFDTFLAVKPKSDLPITPIPKGRILNQSFIPNCLVRIIRNLKLNPKF